MAASTSDDFQIRKYLPYSLGQTNDNWRGCYLPFERENVKMFQIGVRYRNNLYDRAVERFSGSTSPRSLQGIDILDVNLKDYVSPNEETELENNIETKDLDTRRLSRGRDTNVAAGFDALLSSVTAEGSASSATYLEARDRQVTKILPNFEDRVDEMLRRAGPQLESRIMRHADKRQPECIYVVVGTEYARLQATASGASQGQIGMTAGGFGGEAGGGHVYASSTFTQGIVLVRLLKYKFNALLRGPPPTVRVPTTSAGLSDATGGVDTVAGGGSVATAPENSALGAGSAAGASEIPATSTISDLGVELDFGFSSAIGERLPLDDDDDINSGVVHVPLAPTVLHGHSQVMDSSSAIGDGALRELDEANSIIGERLPLDDDDYLNSGIRTTAVALTPSSIRSNTQLESTIEDKARSRSDEADVGAEWTAEEPSTNTVSQTTGRANNLQGSTPATVGLFAANSGQGFVDLPRAGLTPCRDWRLVDFGFGWAVYQRPMREGSTLNHNQCTTDTRYKQIYTLVYHCPFLRKNVGTNLSYEFIDATGGSAMRIKHAGGVFSWKEPITVWAKLGKPLDSVTFTESGPAPFLKTAKLATFLSTRTQFRVAQAKNVFVLSSMALGSLCQFGAIAYVLRTKRDGNLFPMEYSALLFSFIFGIVMRVSSAWSAIAVNKAHWHEVSLAIASPLLWQMAFPSRSTDKKETVAWERTLWGTLSMCVIFVCMGIVEGYKGWSENKPLLFGFVVFMSFIGSVGGLVELSDFCDWIRQLKPATVSTIRKVGFGHVGVRLGQLVIMWDLVHPWMWVLLLVLAAGDFYVLDELAGSLRKATYQTKDFVKMLTVLGESPLASIFGGAATATQLATLKNGKKTEKYVTFVVNSKSLLELTGTYGEWRPATELVPNPSPDFIDYEVEKMFETAKEIQFAVYAVYGTRKWPEVAHSVLLEGHVERYYAEREFDPDHRPAHFKMKDRRVFVSSYPGGRVAYPLYKKSNHSELVKLE